jgi:very-short-patch-repair endonuclease
MSTIPDELHGRPFRTRDAMALGVTRRMLQSSAYTSILPGVFRTAMTTPTLHLHIAAAQLVLPADAAVSHLTCLRLLGYDVGPMWPLHFSTNATIHRQRNGLIIHRRQGELNCTEIDGIRALGPMRTFVDVATLMSDRALLRVGDWLLGRGLMDRAPLLAYVADSHLNGVQRARRVAPHLRAASASPQESSLRWSLVRAGLPEPELNVDIHDDKGAWLARGDLVYRRWKVLVEYDGRHHELDPVQRQWDLRRREQLEAAGWRVIIVTSADMRSPQLIVLRVRQALRRAGYAE